MHSTNKPAFPNILQLKTKTLKKTNKEKPARKKSAFFQKVANNSR